MKNIVRMCMAMMLVLAMVVPTFAAEFVKSIEVKPTPIIINAEIVDEDGNVILELEEGDIIITPLADIDDADIPQEAKDLLKEVYEDLMDGTVTLDEVEGLLEQLKEFLGEEATIDDITIRDLFDVTIINPEALGLMEDGYMLKVTFDLGVDQDEFLAVMAYGEKWDLVYDVQVNADGTVTVIFNHISPIAFLTAGQNMFADGEDIPATGDTTNVALYAGMGVVALGALAGLIVMRRRQGETE